ncbi:MAG: flagellar biosynthetic protein FliO [Planctomycetaceae bacterium]|jgi:flagellar biogenesis protein FliO|nr:flagellar biosynthetic protein FliO [Planctomycetaceae bacterium]
MPSLRILIILIITVVWANILGMAHAIAEEPTPPFIARPSASFVQNNFTKPATASVTSAPIPPKSSEQLRHVREALATTPVITRNTTSSTPQSIQQPIEQPAQQPLQTLHTYNYETSPVQQVTAVEPVHLTHKSTSHKQIEIVEEPIEIAGNTLETPIKTAIAETTTFEKQNNNSANNFSDQLLDKPIGSGKTEIGKKLMNRPKISSAVTPIISVLGSLLIVLGVFFILVLLLKKVSPKGNRLLPKEAFEDLGRAMLTQKIQLHLLRLGNRLLLVSITPDGVSPITEITDPDEVVPLLGLCRQLDTHSSTELFRKTLSSFSTDGTEGGYFGTDVAKVHRDNRKNSTRNSKSKQSTLVDLYSEPDESLAEILAKGGQHG